MSAVTLDPFTMDKQLCDDAGWVRDAYLEDFNRLRALSPIYTYAGPEWQKPVESPFLCTGSAHVAGEHINCTSPAHEVDLSSPFGVPLVTINPVSGADPLRSYTIAHDLAGTPITLQFR